MLRFSLCLALLASSVAACGGGDEDEAAAGPGGADLANTIEAVAHVKEPGAAAAPRRLGVLADADLPADLRNGATCRLQDGQDLLLLASAPGAVARIDGRVVRLAVAAPVGPSGAYFEAPGVTVSIGRRAPLGAAPGGPNRAGVTIGGNPDQPIEKAEASWVCLR